MFCSILNLKLLFRHSLSNMASVTGSVSDEYLKVFPEEKDQYIRVKQEESIYKERHFEVDKLLSSSGEKRKLFTDDFFSESCWQKRWRHACGIKQEKERLLQFLDNSPNKGDIFRCHLIPPYPSEIFQTLKNLTTDDIVYESGRNYFGIGYVDLSPLLWGKFVNEDSGKPIHFYGYEANPVVALRSKVILKLLKADNTEISTRSILQVNLPECDSSRNQPVLRK